MKSTIVLESKDIRQIIAKFLDVPVSDVIPNSYSFSVVGIDIEDIKKRIEDKHETIKRDL